jgi:hypothetical protein
MSMVKQHPQAVAPRNESHLYPIIYEPFRYVRGMSLKKRFQQREWVVKKYGIRPLILGIKTSDLWRGILSDYKNYRRGIRNSESPHYMPGLHNIVDSPTLKRLVKVVQSSPGSDLDKAQDLIRKIINHFCEQHSHAEQDVVFVEKTPLHIKYGHQILSEFPEARLIEVIRDGRDVSVSMKARAKTQRWASTDNQANLRQWTRCISIGKRLTESKAYCSRILTVRYEVLRVEPVQQMQRVFDFAGLPYDMTLVRKIVQQRDISRINNKGEGQHARSGKIGEWKTRLSPAEIEAWKQQAGNLLQDMGYEL